MFGERYQTLPKKENLNNLNKLYRKINVLLQSRKKKSILISAFEVIYEL